MARCGWSFTNSWYGRFDISLWLKPIYKYKLGLELVFFIEDQAKKRTIILDQYSSFSPQDILLTRSTSLTGRGKLKNLEIRLQYQGCEKEDIILDYLHFKPARQVYPQATRNRERPRIVRAV